MCKRRKGVCDSCTLHFPRPAQTAAASTLNQHALTLYTVIEKRGGLTLRPSHQQHPYLPTHTPTASTLKPTLIYGLGGARGDLISAAGGAWGALETGMNPINNNLGASISSGAGGTVNVLNGDDLVPGLSCEW